MKLEGAFSVAAPRSKVWSCITDPGVMAACVPGCSRIEQLSPTSYRAVVAVAIGPIKASFNLVVDVTGEEPPLRVLSSTRGEEGTRASMLAADNVVELAERADGGTDIAYRSEVSVTGRLGKFGLGVMKKKAEALSADFVAAFRAHVERAAGVAA
jgi:carbon monoxide dehydrogenase subunit G